VPVSSQIVSKELFGISGLDYLTGILEWPKLL